MKLHATLAAAGLLLASHIALAGPAAYIPTPQIEAGETEIEFKFGDERDAGRSQDRQYSLAVGYGVSETWFTEIVVSYRKAAGGGTERDAIEWENKVLLTEIGKYAVDVAAFIEIERPRDHDEGWEVKLGPLLQSEHGRWQFNGNLLFEKHIDAAPGAEKEWEAIGQAQVKFRMSQPLELGAQLFTEEDETKAGPAIFGKVSVAEHTGLKYNVAWLKGLNDDTANHTLRAQLELEF